MNQPLSDTHCRRRLYLMRHGEVSYFNDDGTPVTEPNLVTLTKNGRQQAEAMQVLLNDVQVDRAVCSGLIRTKETAARALGDRQLSLEDIAELREIQPKSYTSIPEDLREAELVYAFENAHQKNASYGGGELFSDFTSRVSNAFNKILVQPEWTRMLIVAHDGVNRLLLSMIASNSLNNIQQALGGMGGFDQDPCCLNIIDLDIVDGKVKLARIKAMNITPDNLIKNGNHLTSMEKVFRPYACGYVVGDTEPRVTS